MHHRLFVDSTGGAITQAGVGSAGRLLSTFMNQATGTVLQDESSITDRRCSVPDQMQA